ncbi:hypothetical protein [Halorussus amylolyticus]|nr:hypothetical protein [Halorussus amylolyticus]
MSIVKLGSGAFGNDDARRTNPRDSLGETDNRAGMKGAARSRA